jgi:hypothetical protein
MARSLRAIALKSKRAQRGQRLFRIAVVLRLEEGAYALGLPDMMAVVM